MKNKRGANIEIGEIRPNTYYDYSGCTVDIQIFVYNDDKTRRCKFWLMNYNTEWDGEGLMDGFYESELENNEEFDEDMELTDIYSDKELEKMAWDSIMSDWEFYPEDCPFIDYINRIEDALSNMALEDFTDDGDVEAPDIDALLTRREVDCWEDLDKIDLIDFDAMAKDGIVEVEVRWGEKDYMALVSDFEKESLIPNEKMTNKKYDEAFERAILYCNNHDTNCLALPYALFLALRDTHFVLPWRVLEKTRQMILDANWESDSADAVLMSIRSLLLTELKKSRWVDIDNPHFERYTDCEDVVYLTEKVVKEMIVLLGKLCPVRAHDEEVSFEFSSDLSGDIRRLRKECNIVLPHKILYDFLVDTGLREEYSKQIFHEERSYYGEEYDKSRLAFIRDDVFEQIDDRMRNKVVKEVFDADILLKEYEGETFVLQILNAEADDDFFEETEDGFVTSRGIRYYFADKIQSYLGGNRWTTEYVERFEVMSNDERGYRGKVHIPSQMMYQGKSYPVTEIKSNAFDGCEHVTEIEIDNGVERIWCDFGDCQSLRSITIPASVTKLGKDCFKECDALQVINIDIDNPRYCFEDGVLYEKSDNGEKVELFRTQKPNSKIVKRGTIAGCRYTISDDRVMTIKGDGELDNGGEPLKFSTEHVVIVEGITSIGDTVFWSHGHLQTISIPNTVTEIGSSVFGRCQSLKAPVLPDTITTLGRCAFDECYGFDKIILPCNLKALPLGVFRNCKNLQEVGLSNIERIEEDAFEGCVSLRKIMLPETIKHIGEHAFVGCESLEEVVFPNGRITIEDNIFEGCQALKRVVLPATYAYRNLGNLWGRDYTSLVNNIVEFLPSDEAFPLEAIETFYREHNDDDRKCIMELSHAEKSLKLNESTTIWGFATLTKIYEYANNHNARYSISFEEYDEKIEDDWFRDHSLKSFLWKQFLSKPVDKFDGLRNVYSRYVYKWNKKIPDSRYQKEDFESFLIESKLLGEEIMTPFYTLDENNKIVRLEEPTEMVDTSDAIDGFLRLVGDKQGRIGGIVKDMIKEFGAIKTCRVLGQLMTTGNIIYDEWEIGQETHGGWSYRRNIE